MSRGRGVKFAIVVAIAALGAVTALAISMSERGDAAFPGGNGRIAYSYGDAYQGSIWSANADGTSPTQLTHGSDDGEPAYSANGSRIAFSRENGLYVMNADSSGLTQIDAGSRSNKAETEWRENYKNPKEPSEIIPFVKVQIFVSTWHYFNSPSFSPDGSQLAVGEGRGEFVEEGICAVEEEEGEECIGYEEPDSYFDYNYKCVACTSQIVTVNSSSGARTSEVTPASTLNEDYGPAYSVSGKVAFTRGSSAGYEIFVVNSPGAPPVQVTSGPDDYAPDFSPDGSQIVFDHGSRELGVVGAAGGPVRLLSVPSGSGKSYLGSPAFSPDGSRIAFERTFFPSAGKADAGLYTMALDGSGVTKIVDRAFGPSWQPVPPPPPPPAVSPRAKARKGKIKLDKKATATVGTIVCGSSPCSLKVSMAKLKAGKKACSVKTALAKKLAPGKSTKLGVRVVGKCLASLKKAGKGTLVAKVGVTDALGKKVLTFKSTLVPAKAKKGKKGKK